MKFRIWKSVFCLVGLAVAVSLSGCYKRTTAPTYEFEDSEVTKIREQVGAVTPDKEYKNITEEEEED